MTLEDLGVILAVVGATGSTLVSYILPGLIYTVMHTGLAHQTWEYRFAFAVLLIGIGLIPVCLTFIFL